MAQFLSMFRHLFGQTAVDNKELYSVLGVGADATAREITKAYRSLAMTHHPDKGGDDKKFKAITDAYEVLSNPSRRKEYDASGNRNHNRNQNMNDMFTSMFSGTFPSSSREGGVRPLIINVFLSLEEVCSGSRRSVAYQAQRCCNACAGTGGTGSRSCRSCDGTGITVTSRTLQPGMIQQIQSSCSECGGRGKITVSPCVPCSGIGHTRVQLNVDIAIPPGATHGSKMMFREKGHSLPNTRTHGDVVVGIQVKKHPVFTRVGTDDLRMTQSITLLQALCGYTITIEHVNGHPLDLVSESPRGHDSVHVIKGGGITSTGSLHVTLKVLFPTRTFTDDETRALTGILTQLHQ